MVERVLTPILLTLIVGLIPRSLDAQIAPTYVRLAPSTVKGALYRPPAARMRNNGATRNFFNYVSRWIGSRF
jgi:hypothetical protein